MGRRRWTGNESERREGKSVGASMRRRICLLYTSETPQFLDLLIGQSSAARKKVYSGGLEWLESEAQKKYKLPFSKLDDGQASALLKPWLRTWMSDHPPVAVSYTHLDVYKRQPVCAGDVESGGGEFCRWLRR